MTLVILAFGVPLLLLDQVDEFVNNLEKPEYFLILIGKNHLQGWDEYMTILEYNVNNIMDKLKVIQLLENNCNFGELKKTISEYIEYKTNKIKNDHESMFKYFQFNIFESMYKYVELNMMDDLEVIMEQITSHINRELSYKQIPIRIRCHSVNYEWIFKFYKISNILTSYQFIDNDKNETDDFLLIEHDPSLHEWLQERFASFEFNVIDMNICDGFSRTYTKIMGDIDSDDLKRAMSDWKFISWYHSDDTNVSNAYYYDI